jgi:hypothetical protein
MKATTFRNRGKEKDAYDLYMLIKEYPEGIETLVAELRKHRRNKLVKEALNAASESFQSIESLGPVAVTDFLELTPGEERDILAQDVYQVMNYVLEHVRKQ